MTAAFYFNKREAKPELKIYNKMIFTILFDPYISWGKAEKIAYVSSQSCGIEQKISFPGHAVVLYLVNLTAEYFAAHMFALKI